MRKKHTLITNSDNRRLRSLLKKAAPSGTNDGPLAGLQERMRSARVVGQKHIPRDVVTMNSVVVLRDLQSGHRFTYQLAYPNQAKKFGSISVVRPVGTAILGSRVGEIISWPTGTSERRLRIQTILYQPEAAGDFHL